MCFKIYKFIFVFSFHGAVNVCVVLGQVNILHGAVNVCVVLG